MKPKSLALGITAGLALLLALCTVSQPGTNKGPSAEFDRWNN
jgi:hypothetical protein